MKASRTPRSSVADAEIYRDFLRLDRERRRRIAMRILRNQKMLADLYDHFLIQRSLDEPGHNLAWESYARENRSGR
jgi:hypothetical protein